MGALSSGALQKGGSVIGVEPQEFIDTALQQEGLTELIVTPDMASRKAKMMELGDIFLAFPGGFGTLEEISQVMSEVKLGHLKGRFAFLDFNGYYQPMKQFLEAMRDQGFVDAKWVKEAAFLPSFAASVPLWPAGTCQSRAKRGVTLSRSDTVSSALPTMPQRRKRMSSIRLIRRIPRLHPSLRDVSQRSGS